VRYRLLPGIWQYGETMTDQRPTVLPSNQHIITIVSGLPRSGTSMMMKMLEAGGLPSVTDNIRTADEDNPKGYYEFERVKQLPKGDVAWLPDAQGKVVKVIAALLPHLPGGYQYRVVFMQRAMPEVLASQRQMLIRRGEDPDKIPDDVLAKLFEKHLKQVDDWIAQQPNVARLDVNYNEMLKNAQPFIEQIAMFLGNQLDKTRMATVVDPALHRQRSV
jgi:broad-specificity NMP kinase